MSRVAANKWDLLCDYCGRILRWRDGRWSCLHPDCVARRSPSGKERGE